MISESLIDIFNLSISMGVSPEELKNATVTPLYNNTGKRTGPTNYRPISIIAALAKVFERIISDQLCNYGTSNK